MQAATRSAILSRSGLNAIVAHDPIEALYFLERADLRISVRLLITDHLMPAMNGPELVERVRLILPMLPVLVLSGLAGAEAEYQDVSFRLKPFPPEELIRTANLLLGNPVLRSA